MITESGLPHDALPAKAPTGQQASVQLEAGLLETRAGPWGCCSGPWETIALPTLSSCSGKLERQFGSRKRSQAVVLHLEPITTPHGHPASPGGPTAAAEACVTRPVGPWKSEQWLFIPALPWATG